MKDFIQNSLEAFGSKPPVFYHCCCGACGFRQKYEVGTGTVVYADAEAEAEDDTLVVTQVPHKCPKCGAKLFVLKLPKVILY